MIGERINNYEVRSIVGEGGMGAVYLAEHPFMGRKAAIKVLRPELAQDRGLVERFMNEARAANAIHHPNIIDIIDVGLLPSGVPYLMMEFLEGESLAKRIERGRLPVAEAVDVATQTASALQAAHGKEIVHRDLKPDNLFLVPDDGRPFGARVKVLDFGIAKLRGELSGGGAKTQTGSVMGTPPYMSPEQCRGITEEIDHRTDVYALGIILFEMLVGAPPFMSPGWGDIVLMHVTKPVPPPRAKNPAIPAELEAVILKALAKPPDDRWQSMNELDAALRTSIGAPPRGFASGFRPGSGPAVPDGDAAPAHLRTPTTLGSASGEVAPGQNESDRAAVPRRPIWRRPSLLVGGGAALAAMIATLAIGGRRAPAPKATGAATFAAPLPAPAPDVAIERLAPRTTAPVPSVSLPAPAEPARGPGRTNSMAAATAEPDDAPVQEQGKRHAHRHDARAAKKTASATPSGPTTPPATPGPVQARSKQVEKW